MGTTPALQPTLVGVLSSTSTSSSLMEVRGQKQTLSSLKLLLCCFNTANNLLWLLRQTLIIHALVTAEMCGFPILFLCVAVPLIAQVAVRFVTSSSLEVVTRLTTNGGRDVLRYYVGLGDAP